MKKVEISDIYEFTSLSGVQMAPAGTGVFLTRTKMDKASDSYKSDLYLYDHIRGLVRMTASGDVKNATVDGSRLIFSAARNGEDKKKETAFYALPVDGGEAAPLFTVKEKGVSIVKMLPSFNVVTFSRSLSEMENEDRIGEYSTFTELPFWFNAQGIVDKKRKVLALTDKQGAVTKELTAKYFNTDSAAVSPDGHYIAYNGQEYTDVSSREDGLYLYDTETGETKTVLEYGKAGTGSLIFVDENTLFYASHDYTWPGRSPHFFLYDCRTAETRELPFADREIGCSIGSDAASGSGKSMRVYNGTLYLMMTDRSSAVIGKLNAEGAFEPVFRFDGKIGGFDLDESGIYFTGICANRPDELYRITLDGKDLLRLTDENGTYVEDRYIAEPEYFTFTGASGTELEAFVLKPFGYDPAKTYPAVFEIHGGPKVTFGKPFHHEMQVLAGMGYFVFYTNPRGSDGRGEEFANVTCKMGDIDYDDLMAVHAEVLKRYPQIDKKHVGIAGGSYGGFMCNWMIGHTDAFAAAASQRSISNYMTKALTTDIGFNHNMSQLGTDIWHNFDKFWDNSPLKYAPNAKTPTLFIQSDEDYRCWMADALQMYTALKLNHVDTRIALFHGENHELSRSGKPSNREKRLAEITGWFEKYLK